MEVQENTRARALIAIGALLGLGLLVAGILVLGGSDDGSAEAAPSECVELWNSDERAISTGAHNSAAHSYTRVQVAYADDQAQSLSPEPVDGGGCIVVFAARALDPEPVAAAEIHLDGKWRPMSTLLSDFERLAELQSDALAGANAELTADGRVTALES
jgi:hypothetical protein